jgi:hypothetical protein
VKHQLHWRVTPHSRFLSVVAIGGPLLKIWN